MEDLGDVHPADGMRKPKPEALNPEPCACS